MPNSVELPSPMNAAGYASRRVTKPPNWHGLVAFDMLFNNMTTGLFLVAAAGELMSRPAFGRLTWLAYPLALLFLTIDLACLVLDLGHRFRFHHMLRVFKPSSPMSLGTWCLTAYSIPLGLLATIEVLEMAGIREIPAWMRWASIATGIPFAMGSAMYKGVVFSTTSQPGWKDARWLGGYLTNSAIAIGCAELLAIADLLGQGPYLAIRTSLLALLAINLGFLLVLRVEIRPAIRTLKEGSRLNSMLILGTAVGVWVPAILFLVSGNVPAIVSVIIDEIAVVLVLAGNFLVRRSIVMLPHHENDDGAVARWDGDHESSEPTRSRTDHRRT